MILKHEDTGTLLIIGDKITVTADGSSKGKIIKVQRIDEPDVNYPGGRIIYNIQGKSWMQFLPSLFGYIWVEE